MKRIRKRGPKNKLNKLRLGIEKYKLPASHTLDNNNLLDKYKLPISVSSAKSKIPTLSKSRKLAKPLAKPKNSTMKTYPVRNGFVKKTTIKSSTKPSKSLKSSQTPAKPSKQTPTTPRTSAKARLSQTQRSALEFMQGQLGAFKTQLSTQSSAVLNQHTDTLKSILASIQEGNRQEGDARKELIELVSSLREDVHRVLEISMEGVVKAKTLAKTLAARHRTGTLNTSGHTATVGSLADAVETVAVRQAVDLGPPKVAVAKPVAERCNNSRLRLPAGAAPRPTDTVHDGRVQSVSVPVTVPPSKKTVRLSLTNLDPDDPGVHYYKAWKKFKSVVYYLLRSTDPASVPDKILDGLDMKDVTKAIWQALRIHLEKTLAKKCPEDMFTPEWHTLLADVESTQVDPITFEVLLNLKAKRANPTPEIPNDPRSALAHKWEHSVWDLCKAICQSWEHDPTVHSAVIEL